MAIPAMILAFILTLGMFKTKGGLGINVMGMRSPNNTITEVGGSFHLQCLPHDYWMTRGNYWYIYFSVTSIVCRLQPAAARGMAGTGNCTGPYDLSRFSAYRMSYVLMLDVKDVQRTDAGLYVCAQPPPWYHVVGELGLLGVVGVVYNGPNVTAITHASGDVHLRCFVEFVDVYRTNAHVTWHKNDGARIPLIRATALSATIKSPGCTAARRRRKKRQPVTTPAPDDSGKYKCRVRWDRSRPYVPGSVQHDFLTLGTSHNEPSLELCVATDPCAKDTKRVKVCVKKSKDGTRKVVGDDDDDSGKTRSVSSIRHLSLSCFVVAVFASASAPAFACVH